MISDKGRFRVLMSSARVHVPVRGVGAWRRSRQPAGRAGDAQAATAGSLTVRLSLTGAMDSSVMHLLETAHSSFCSSRMAPISRVMASALGKMPTTLVRRLISACSRSIGLVTGMTMSVPRPRPDSSVSGLWCDHPGQRHREYEGAGRPIYSMSCELVLVAGRLCDSPGCAESADP